MVSSPVFSEASALTAPQPGYTFRWKARGAKNPAHKAKVEAEVVRAAKHMLRHMHADSEIPVASDYEKYCCSGKCRVEMSRSAFQPKTGRDGTAVQLLKAHDTD